MSLREEIEEQVRIYTTGAHKDTQQQLTDEIMSRIEKRIDEIKKLNLTTDDYTFLSNFWRSCDIVKEYLLK